MKLLPRTELGCLGASAGMLFLPCPSLGILLRVERLNDLERMELERGRIGGGPSDGLPMCKGFVFTRPERFEYGVSFFLPPFPISLF